MELRWYKNKNIGPFLSLQSVYFTENNMLDSIYFAVFFSKLSKKSIHDIRGSIHYNKTISSWKSKLENDVDSYKLGDLARILKLNLEIYKPFATKQHNEFIGGTSSRTAQLLQISKHSYKPMKFGGDLSKFDRYRNIGENENKKFRKTLPQEKQPMIENKMKRRYSLREMFSFHDSDKNVQEPLKYIDSIFNEYGINSDNVLSYLIIGEASLILFDSRKSFSNTEPTALNGNIFCSVELSEERSFIKNSKVHLNLQGMQRQKSFISSKILENLQHFQKVSEEKIFFDLAFISKTEYSGGVGDENRSPTGAADGLLELSMSVPKGEKRNRDESTDFGQRKQQKMDMENTYRKLYFVALSNGEKSLLKISKDSSIDAQYENEDKCYRVITARGREFKKHVADFIGYGIVKSSSLVLQNKTIHVDPIHNGHKFIATEFDTRFCTVTHAIAYLFEVPALAENFTGYSQSIILENLKSLQTSVYSNRKMKLTHICEAVSNAISIGSESIGFFHADLHSGNVLVRMDFDEKSVELNENFGWNGKTHDLTLNAERSMYEPVIKLVDFHSSSNARFQDLNERVYKFSMNRRLYDAYKQKNSVGLRYIRTVDIIRFIVSIFWNFKFYFENLPNPYFGGDFRPPDNHVDYKPKSYTETAYMIETIYDLMPTSNPSYMDLWLKFNYNGLVNKPYVDPDEGQDLLKFNNIASEDFLNSVISTYFRKLEGIHVRFLWNGPISNPDDGPKPILTGSVDSKGLYKHFPYQKYAFTYPSPE